MRNNLFCHLHVHTTNSLLDGCATAKQYVKRAKELGFECLACTDHGNIDGLVKFQTECDKQGISPILGCEAYIVPDAKKKVKGEKRGHITLLIKNQAGWENMCRLLTYANLEGFYYRPRIDYRTLLDHIEGLVVLTGCAGSFLNIDGGMDFFNRLHGGIGQDLYLEVMPHDIDAQHAVNKKCIGCNKKNPEIKMVASNDCHYVNDEDWEAQEVLLAIRSKAKWTDKNRFRFGFIGLYLRSADEMIEAFEKRGQFTRHEYLNAMRNALEVAKKCRNFRVEKRDVHLPVPKMPKMGMKERNYFIFLCKKGYREKFSHSLEENDIYFERFKNELHLLEKKGFLRYFLIVYNLVNWCKENGIMVGPGRGSVGASLIAYLLGITLVDPIKFKLLFARFISEEREDLPDIDLDFEDSKRPLVREYLIETYGANSIAGISTFLTMKGKAAIRDIARVFDLPNVEVNSFAESIDDTAKENTIKLSIKETEEGKDFYEKFPKETDLAIKLEGLTRNCGQHAAAVVISSDDLSKSAQGNLVMRNKNVVVNWDMEDCEHMGLMKLDILGLNTLSILSETKKLIKKNHDKDIDFESISLEDKKTLREFAKGNTTGCFQFNSYGITRLCKKLEIDSFDMLVHANALYRPGTLQSGMVDEFVERKRGKKWEKINKDINDITKDTFGIVCYQEQLMNLVHEVAGMTWQDAGKIRKVISKSKGTKELHKFKTSFVEGCVKNKTLMRSQASKLWETLETFGKYSFNLAHAVAYTMIGFWCQYCKVHYLVEFICASLTFGTESKKEELVNEAYRLGLSVVLPKIGISHSTKWIAKDRRLYVPFVEIKGIGEKLAVKIEKMKPRKKTFKGFFGLKRKERKSKFNQILEDIGAFDNDVIPSESALNYFSFKISNDFRLNYPHLHEILEGDYFAVDSEDILAGKIRFPNIIRRTKNRKSMRNIDLLECAACELRKEATKPVLPTLGKYNVAIIGEAPGIEEDKKKRPFVGKSGNLVWGELEKYDLERQMFHTSNVIKCFPSISKTPNRQQIKICSRWLDEELKRLSPRIILAFGNTCMKYFLDRNSGIKALNGKTEWNERFSAWICWCIHPASVLYDSQNREDFEKGIKNFAEILKRFGMK